MSEAYKTIVLVTDGTQDSQIAAQTALDLAKRHSARVHVVDTVQPPSVAATWFTSNAEELFDIVVADKQERLDKVAHVFSDAGIDVKVEILFGKSSAEIAKVAQTEQADLVVRYMKGPRSRQSGTFGTTALNLMRVCPCPLLLVGDRAVDKPKVLACVNAEHDSKENEAILNEATKLASDPDRMHALYCWKFYGSEFLTEYMDEATISRYQDEASQNYHGLYERFLKQHNLNADGVHIKNGDPVEVIPEVCQSESVDVVVMSSASQNHPLHRLLGSTVESVLDALPCSLLVVKPIGFKSPIKVAQSKIGS